jgi:tetratricopeptide (TPR) repeat protein
VRDWLAELPPLSRWILLGAGGLLVALFLGLAVSFVFQQREVSARRAFAAIAASYQPAMTAGEDARLAEVAKTLSAFLKDHPRSAPAAQGWYLLGNVEYRRGAHDAALAAFGEAARRDRGSVGALSRLGAGYAWEAKNEPARALEAYQEVLQGRGPKDFLFGEALLAVARTQEQLKQPDAAIASYRRLLKEAPDTPRAEEARARLAVLGAAAA